MQERTIPPDMPLAVTMTAQQWLLIQQLLGDAPYRVAAGLIGEIQRQCVAQAERELLPAPMPGKGNGSVPIEVN